MGSSADCDTGFLGHIASVSSPCSSVRVCDGRQVERWQSWDLVGNAWVIPVASSQCSGGQSIDRPHMQDLA